MMWVLMAVSAAALAAGLAGIVLAGDWKLLLVLPVGMGLTHGFSELHFRNVAKLEKKLAEHQKAVGWIDAAFSAFVLATALMLPMLLIGRFTAFKDDGRWMKICWYAGLAIMPWGYGWRDATERYERWVAFLCVAAIAGALVFFWGPRTEDISSGIVYAGMAAIFGRHFIVSRKGVAA